MNRFASSAILGLLLGCVCLLVPTITRADSPPDAGKSRETIQIGVLNLEADQILDDGEGTRVLSGNVTINERVAFDGEATVSGSTLTGNGKLSVLNVPGLGDLDILEGPIEINVNTARFSNLASVVSRLQVSGLDASLDDLAISEDGVTVTGALSVGGEEIKVANLAITGSGASLDDGTIDLGKISFELTGTVINSSIFTADTLTGTAGPVTVTLNNFEISSSVPTASGGSFQAGGLSGAFSSVSILSKGISAGTASLSGLPGESSFSVSNFLATDQGATIGEGSLEISSFQVSLSSGEFSHNGLSVASGNIRAGSSNLLLKDLVAGSSGLTMGSGNLKVSGLDVYLEDFSFSEKSTELAAGKAELKVNNTTDFMLENFRLHSGGNVSATGGGFKAGQLEVQFSGATFDPNDVKIGNATLKAGSQDIIVENLVVKPGGVTVGEAQIDLFGGHADFTAGSFTGSGFSVSSANLTFGSAASFAVTGLVVTHNGVTLKGGSFQFAGLAVSFAATPAGAGSLDVKGSLKLPDEFSGASVDFEFRLTDGHVQVVSGRLQVKEFQIPKTPVGLSNRDIQFDQTVIKGEATASFPVFALTAGVEIRNGRFNAFKVSVSNLNQPIGNTGAFLQSVGVSGKHLSRQIECNDVYIPVVVKSFGGNIAEQFLSAIAYINQNQNRYKQTIIVILSSDGRFAAGYYEKRNVCGIPPIEFTGSTSVTAGPQEFGQAFVRVDAGTTFDDTGNFRLDGSVKMLFLEIGSAYLAIHPSGSNAGTSAGGTFVWDAVINGKGSVSVDMRGNPSGKAEVSLSPPSDIPLIGGKKFGSVSISVDRSKVKGGVSVVVGKVTFTIENRHFSTGFSKDSNLRPWEVSYRGGIPLKDLMDPAADKEMIDMAEDYVFSVLTNYDAGKRVYHDDPGGFKGLSLAGIDGPEKGKILNAVEETFTLQAGVPTIIRLNYETDTGNPTMYLTDPAGFVYTPAAFPYDEDDVERIAHFSLNPAVPESYWLFNPPTAGDHKVTILFPATLGEYVLEVLEPNEPSNHDEVVAVTDGEFLRIDWEGGDVDDDAVVSVWLSKEHGSQQGFLIAGPVAESDVDGSVVVNLGETILPSGLFYAAVSIEDGRNAPVWRYSDEPVFIVDADAPEPVQKVTAGNIEDGVVVSWEPIDDPDIIGYQVRWTDDPSSPRYPFVRSSNPDQSSLPIPELNASTYYRFAVAPIRERDGNKAANHGLVARLAELGEGAKHLPDFKGLGDARLRALTAQADQLRQYSHSAGKSFARVQTDGVYREAPWELLSKDEFEFMDLSQAPVLSSRKILNINPTGNNPPIAGTTPPSIAFVGEAYIHEFVFFDPEGDDMEVRLERGPESVMLTLVRPEEHPGILSMEWTPTRQDRGVVEFMVSATDEFGARTELSWAVDVTSRGLDSSGKLHFTGPNPLAVVLPGGTFSHQFHVYSPDETTPLAYMFLNSPPGMVIDSSGLLEWNSGSLAIGSYPTTLLVRQDCPTCPAGRREATLHFRGYVVESILEGDLNNDGVISVEDFILFQRLILGDLPFTESIRRITDINADGIIDAADLIELRNRPQD